jgi:cation:H+ antiporter
MDIPYSLAAVLGGLVLLYFGARWLVEGAAAMALKRKVSRLVIGLTIVAIGTSAPEAILAFLSSLEGSNQLSLGNVIGANIANIGLVLGVACIISPIVLRIRQVKVQAAFMIVAIFMLMALALDGSYDLVDGVLFFGMLNLFFIALFVGARRGGPLAFGEEEIEETSDLAARPEKVLVAMIVLGAAFLAVGAQLVIEGASSLALSAGVSEKVIGFTLVAFGTTVPELTVGITASRKGESEIIIGNIMGTIVVNSLFVIGISALVAGVDTSGAFALIDLVVMSAFVLALLGVMATRDRLSRPMGAVFMLSYLSYLVIMLAIR